MTRKFALGLTAGAIALIGSAGFAIAQHDNRPKIDTDGNGTISRAESQARSAQMFARLDINRDGKLDAADREAQRTARFDRLDADKNGQLSRAEFDAMRPGMGAGRMEGERRGKHGMDGHGGGHGGGMMRMAAAADTNKDQSITRAEFDTTMAQRFARTDADNNGELTPAERQAARAAMRAQWQARRAAPASSAPAAPATGT